MATEPVRIGDLTREQQRGNHAEQHLANHVILHTSNWVSYVVHNGD